MNQKMWPKWPKPFCGKGKSCSFFLADVSFFFQEGFCEDFGYQAIRTRVRCGLAAQALGITMGAHSSSVSAAAPGGDEKREVVLVPKNSRWMFWSYFLVPQNDCTKIMDTKMDPLLYQLFKLFKWEICVVHVEIHYVKRVCHVFQLCFDTKTKNSIWLDLTHQVVISTPQMEVLEVSASTKIKQPRSHSA